MNNEDTAPSGRTCTCPYCDAAAAEPLPYCTVCGKEVARCPNCKEVIKVEDDKCPRCGVALLGEDTEQ